MEKGYCVECDEYVDYTVNDVTRRVTVRGVAVEANTKEVVCKKCGNPVFVYDIEVLNDISVFDEYKKKINLMTTKELVGIREKMGMSQEEFAKYLGLTLKEIQRYEHGVIQTEEVDKLFKTKLLEEK